MAAIAPSKDRGLDLNLADEDFDVTHSGPGDTCTVKITMEPLLRNGSERFRTGSAPPGHQDPDGFVRRRSSR